MTSIRTARILKSRANVGTRLLLPGVSRGAALPRVADSVRSVDAARVSEFLDMMAAMIAIDPSDVPDQGLRAQLIELLQGIDPWDEQERAHLVAADEWIASGAPLHRTQKPDVPTMHLVSYFVVLDEARRELLLVAHRAAGLWLPSGGHVEPLEDPWDAVARECGEELRIEATPSAVCGKRPFFLTITRTRGVGQHTDVSLWFILNSQAGAITSFDRDEFEAIKWLSPQQVLAEPLDTLDPHMHRFTNKLMAAVARPRP